jgi:hypothetical protein
MEGFSFVTPVTGLNRPNTGKEDDDDDDDDISIYFEEEESNENPQSGYLRAKV